jgi:hypothetical protein
VIGGIAAGGIAVEALFGAPSPYGLAVRPSISVAVAAVDRRREQRSPHPARDRWRHRLRPFDGQARRSWVRSPAVRAADRATRAATIAFVAVTPAHIRPSAARCGYEP